MYYFLAEVNSACMHTFKPFSFKQVMGLSYCLLDRNELSLDSKTNHDERP